MSLQKASINLIPENAKLLSHSEALDYQWKRIENCKNPFDKAALNYGSSILGSSSMIYGLFISDHYRRVFKLRMYGKVAMNLPVVIIPAIVTGFYHYQTVLPSVILQDSCPICLQVRSGSFQSILGTLIPTLLASTSALLIATHYATFNVPYISSNPRKVLELWVKVTKPISNKIFYAVLAQALLGMAVTYFEERNILKINQSDQM